MRQVPHDNPRDAEDAARLAESAAILKRVRQETEPQVGAHVASMATGAVAHFAARDADQSDRLEVIGTRIGRVAGLVGFLLLGLALLSQLA
ncbi:hypothetical protein [Aureimonas psammosilenae]|uniref:hypothetical protein n=1 Tax=Aureimonas psammosilenae TaxID=2495496 RepID=UPI0012611182|nr:hypothetical protein [Aureimonas psammosilenae]